MNSNNNLEEAGKEVVLVEAQALEEDEKERIYIWIIFLVASMLLFIVVIGFSFSLFNNSLKGNKVPISSGVIFNYSDGDGSKNSVNLKNARDIKDEVGKKISGENSYFDFNVSGNTKNMLKKYMILLEKDEVVSSIPDSDIKVYLTRVNGVVEEELVIDVPTYSELEEIVIEGKTYKVLYVNEFDEKQNHHHNENKFNHDYIFRMWIRENAEDYYGKTYSVKVHIYTEGVGELCD